MSDMKKRVEEEMERIKADRDRAQAAVKVILMKLSPEEDLIDTFLDNSTLVAENPTKAGHFFIFEHNMGHMVEVRGFLDEPTAFFYGPFTSPLQQVIFQMGCISEVEKGVQDERLTELKKSLNEEPFTSVINSAKESRDALLEFKDMLLKMAGSFEETEKGSRTLH